MKTTLYALPLLVLASGCALESAAELREQVDGVDEDLKSFKEGDFARLQTEVDDVTNRAADHESRLGTVETDLSALQSTVNTLSTSVTTGFDSVNGTLGDLTTRVALLEASVTSLQSSVTALTIDLNNTLDVAISTLGDELSGEIDALASDVTTLQDQQVPIGTIIDWYRPSATTALPDGWELADGSRVSDRASPFDGEYKPDLRDKFTRGVSDMDSNDEVGTTGGSDSHSHTTDTTHSHTGYTSEGGSHSHLWIYYESSGLTTYDGQGTEITDNVDGFGSEGAGYYGPNWPTSYGSTSFYTSTGGSHDHDVYTYSAGGVTTSSGSDNVPAYVGMVKLIRVR